VLAVPVTFAAMKNRDIDIFLGNWMPAQSADRKPFVDDGSVDVIGANLQGAKYTLAVPAYNLELFGGRLHNDTWFALAWGGFPAFTGYFANALTITPTGLLIAAACCLTSLAQRRLSTPARDLRRRTCRPPRNGDVGREGSNRRRRRCHRRTRTRSAHR